MNSQTMNSLDRRLLEEEIHANGDWNNIRSFSCRQEGVILVFSIQAYCRVQHSSSQVYSDNLVTESLKHWMFSLQLLLSSI